MHAYLMRLARVVHLRAVSETVNETGVLAAQAAAKKANMFGVTGAGGSSNEGNFTGAKRWPRRRPLNLRIGYQYVSTCLSRRFPSNPTGTVPIQC